VFLGLGGSWKNRETAIHEKKNDKKSKNEDVADYLLSPLSLDDAAKNKDEVSTCN